MNWCLYWRETGPRASFPIILPHYSIHSWCVYQASVWKVGRLRDRIRIQRRPSLERRPCSIALEPCHSIHSHCLHHHHRLLSGPLDPVHSPQWSWIVWHILGSPIYYTRPHLISASLPITNRQANLQPSLEWIGSRNYCADCYFHRPSSLHHST